MKKKEVIARIHLTNEDFIKKVDLAALSKSRDMEETFTNIEISDLIVENKAVRRTDFSFSKLSNVTFSGVNLEGTDFSFTELENVTFKRCRLFRGKFDYAAMKNVVFENCVMNTSCFDYASGNVLYNKCLVHGMELHHTLADVTFNECAGEAMEANFCPALNIHAKDCDFHRAEFIDSTFIGEMDRCVFAEADFAGSDCSELLFNACKMRNIGTNGALGIEIAAIDEEDFDF